MRRFGFYCALAVVFIRFSMIHEALSYLLHINFYLLYIFGPPAIAGCLFSGGLRRTFQYKPARYWIGFVVCMICATPFSSWLGGSVEFLSAHLKTEFPLLFLVAGLTMTWKECLAVVNAIAAAALVSVIFSKILSVEEAGRVVLTMQGGSIANSNDYAAHLIVVLPFLVAFAMRPNRAFVFKLGAAGILCYSIFIILGTASRGAMVALIMCCLVLFLKATMPQRLAIVVTLPIAVILLISVLPAETRGRLTNFATSTKQENSDAAGSAEERTYLLKQSIRFSLENPLLGVGPGQFASYEGGVSREAGQRGSWHQAHNSFTQVSAECGIPALIFYTTALVSGIRLLNRTNKKARQYGPRAAGIQITTLCALIAVGGFLTAIAFLNFYPKFYLPALVGIMVTFSAAAERELGILAIPPRRA